MAQEDYGVPLMALDPFPQYRIMRESNPVFYNEKVQWWEVYRYSDVLRIINDHVTFSSERVAAQVGRPLSILRMDPPFANPLFLHILSRKFYTNALYHTDPIKNS